ncbi:Retrovirus-related Pol polyprotein [Labeo rohita]|uniref:Gypsy retrotransposon integrase-like protein 1 n=1 Tax=Labeo rohita TaxID=84645 RepID=A0ABQ8L461_LABRO|nr:Retrovirus-related Pol polyprotein [Labeo rohita]
MIRLTNVSLCFPRQQRVTDSPRFFLEHVLDTHYLEAPDHRLHFDPIDAIPPSGELFHHACLTAENGALVPEMEQVLQRLAEVSIRQQQIRQGRTEDEITAIRSSAAQRVPLPDPRAQASRLLPKMAADDDVELISQRAELNRIAQHWLLEGNPTAAQIAERAVVDRLLRALPRSHRRAVGMRNPTSILELVEAIELADAVQQREAGDRAPPFPRRVVQERRQLEGTSRPVSRSTVSPPRDEPMPSAEPITSPRAWLAGYIVHQRVPVGAPEADVTIEGKPFRALLDSGSTVTLIQTRLCPPQSGYKSFLPITCVHGDTRQVPTRKVTISTAQGFWPTYLWPYCLEETDLDSTSSSPPPPSLPALKGTVEDGNGHVDPATDQPSLPPTAGEMAAGGGSFAKEQREDDRLKHCWTQVRVVDGKDILPRPHPLPHFVVENGLLYCVAQRRGEEKKLLVVPRTKTETVLELAHSHPMAGHLGAANTTQRIRDHFHWPGLDAEVKRFCQACPTCQTTAPRTPPPSPLIPLPIIEVPFKRIGMDIVGPLPKSARGHEHILVIVDYATRYPEAVPLRKATAKNIAQELFLLASRVGIPTEILTDQGTPFMSRLMADLCRLLRVKQLRTTVYHPQTDGLVERFNQTLKQMLRRVAAEDKRDWDLMIPYVLFGIREVPQASTAFTPFELLFGRQPRGLLDIAR